MTSQLPGIADQVIFHFRYLMKDIPKLLFKHEVTKGAK